MAEKIKRGFDWSRLGTLPGKALFGDVPFLRHALPHEAISMKPEGMLEKTAFYTPKLIRDFYVAGKIGALKSLPAIAAGGAAYGAATAGSEDPEEIKKRAVTEGALFGTIGAAAKFLPPITRKAYEKLAPKFAKKILGKIAQRLAISLPPETPITALNTKRLDGTRHIANLGFQRATILEKTLTPAQLEALSYIRHGFSVPKKLQTPELMEVMNNPEAVNMLKPLAKKIGSPFRMIRRIAKESGYDWNVIKQYLPLIWKNYNQVAKTGGTKFITKSRHFLTRKTLTSGDFNKMVEEFGLIPEMNAAKLIRSYFATVPRALFNRNFLKSAKNIKGTNGDPLYYTYKKGLKFGVDKLGWQTNNNPTLLNAFNPVIGKSKMGLLRSQQPIWMNPEFAPELIAATQGRIHGNVVRAVEKINATAKFLNLTASGFHPVAITESGIGSKVPILKTLTKIVKSIKQNKAPIMTKEGIMWSKYGVNVGTTSDIQRDVFFSLLNNTHDNLVARGIKTLQKPLKGYTRWVFDYYIPTFKIATANNLLSQALAHPSLKTLASSPGGVAKIKRFIVSPIVNDFYGGQEMQKLLISPRMKQMAHWFMLSPDWFLSTMRQATMPWGVGGRTAVENAFRAEVGREFWKTGMVTLIGMMNQMNRANTKFAYGEARDMWNNTPGKQTHLFIGNAPNGEERYMRWGKQFRELIEWFINPPRGAIQKLTGKMSPLMRAGKEQFWPYPYGNIAKATGKGLGAEWGARGIEAAKTFLPFSVSSMQRRQEISPLMFAFPVSSGMKYYKALQLFKEAYRSKSVKKFENVYKHALNNGLNAKKLYKVAWSEYQYEESGGYKETEKIIRKLSTIERHQWPEYIKSLNLSDKQRKLLKTRLKDLLRAEKLRERTQRRGVQVPREYGLR